MRIFLLCFVYLILSFFTSCKKYQASKNAFFIEPGKISVYTTANQGSREHKISDLWVYVNGNFKGVYPIENKIPIASEGKNVNIIVFPGIKNNGISDTRVPWPIYNQIQIDTLVENGKTISRNFTFTYNSTTTFKWMEDFDNQGQSLVKSSNSSVASVSLKSISNQESIEGKYLELTILAGGDYAQIETFTAFEMPKANPNVYLELNYKSNNPFVLGLIGDNSAIKDVFKFNVANEWKKSYIQLAGVVNNEPISNSYKICFYMPKTDAETPRLLLDNLKLVYL